LATAPLLEFKLAHARARDAVHEPLDQARLAADLGGLGLPVRTAVSAAEDRQTYLMRPDLGRRHAQPVLAELLPTLRKQGVRVAPPVVVRHGRVAIGDTIAALLGERPGLTAPDSMGAYLTWRPSPRSTDAERNCISNIRPDGIGYADAATKLAFLLGAIRARQLSGVQLKDDSDRLLSGGQ
jgi:ethanolamine ammonia-lyase small subunit